MKKVFSIFAALTLSAGLWAEMVNVSYLYPVYKTNGDVTSGIKEWKTTTVDATVIVVETIPKPVTWGTAGQTTWLVVNGTDLTIIPPITCAGDVRLILADNAKLSAMNSIIVTGTNSLTIYAQSTGTQMGELKVTSDDGAAGIGGGKNQSGNNITINGGQITATADNGSAGIGGGNGRSGSNITINGGIVKATGQKRTAGIGGGNESSGSNITINGGEVTATGGEQAAGIGGGSGKSGSNITINGGEVTATGGEMAAGIGGGFCGSGSDITILAGKVTANGGNNAAGIGNGKDAQTDASNIFVATSLQVKADNNNPPTTVITNTGADLASSLAGQQYVVTSEIDIPSIKTAAIAAVNDAIAEGDNLYVKEIATRAVSFINAATNVEIIEALKTQALSNIASARAAYGEGVIAGYNTGHAAGEEAGIAVGIGIGYQQAQDELPTEGDCGPTVIITKGDKTLTLYNVDNVEYKVTECGGYK